MTRNSCADSSFFLLNDNYIVQLWPDDQ